MLTKNSVVNTALVTITALFLIYMISNYILYSFLMDQSLEFQFMWSIEDGPQVIDEFITYPIKSAYYILTQH